jgi:hypothetical protein
MIFLYLTAIALSVLAYFSLKKHSSKFRFAVAAVIFSALAILPTIILVIIGDKALPDAKVVTNVAVENIELHKNKP